MIDNVHKYVEDEVFSALEKISDEKAEEILEKLSDYDPLPKGIVTDGYGQLYYLPTEGTTDPAYIDENDDFVYTYSWEDNKIRVYAKEYKTGNYIFTYTSDLTLSPEDYVDNPKYWYMKAYDDMVDWGNISEEDYIVDEALEIFGEVIDDDKSLYEYVIECQVDRQFNSEEDESNYYDTQSEQDKKFNSVVDGYHITEELYGETLTTVAEYNDFFDQLKLKVEFPLPMTKDDLLEVFDDYQTGLNDTLKVLDGFNYTVKLEIEKMMRL